MTQPVLVQLKPGTAAEQSMRFVIPEGMIPNGLSGSDVTIDQVVQYAIGLSDKDGLQRGDLKIQERVRAEMRNRYGLSINGKAVEGSAKLSGFVTGETSPKGQPYFLAQIIVASRQEGAKNLDYLL